MNTIPQLCDECGGHVGRATCTCRDYRKEVADLQQRLLDRTEASTATAYRDAEVIRQLRQALTAVMVLRPHHGFCGSPVTEDSCRCHPANKAARVVLGEWAATP